MKIRRHNLAEMISVELNVPKKYVDSIIVLFMKNVKETILDGKNIFLRGFGTFGVKKRKQSRRRNPKTNGSIIVPEHNIVYFRPGKELKFKNNLLNIAKERKLIEEIESISENVWKHIY